MEVISPNSGHLKGGATVHLTFPKLEDLKAKAAAQAAAKAGNTAYIPPSQRVTNTQPTPNGFNPRDIRVVFQFVPKDSRNLAQLRNVTEVDKSCEVVVGEFKVGTDGVIPEPDATLGEEGEGGRGIGLDRKRGGEEEELLEREHRYVECVVPYCRSNMKIANVLVTLNNYDLVGLSNYGWCAPAPPLPLRFRWVAGVRGHGKRRPPVASH